MRNFLYFILVSLAASSLASPAIGATLVYSQGAEKAKSTTAVYFGSDQSALEINGAGFVVWSSKTQKAVVLFPKFKRAVSLVLETPTPVSERWKLTGQKEIVSVVVDGKAVKMNCELAAPKNVLTALAPALAQKTESKCYADLRAYVQSTIPLTSFMKAREQWDGDMPNEARLMNSYFVPIKIQAPKLNQTLATLDTNTAALSNPVFNIETYKIDSGACKLRECLKLARTWK